MTQISIAATTDIHGFLDEGLTALPTTLQEISADLLLDNGDFFVGSSFASFGYDQGALSPLVTIANELAYDVMIPGNHDLDFGLTWLLRQVAELKADYICANLKDADGVDLFPAYTIKTIKDSKVAVIGLMTAAFSQLSSLAVAEEVLVVDPFVALRGVLEHLHPEACDLVIVCYHGGLTNDPKTGATWFYPSSEDQAYQLMEAFPEIDSLICGHQHFTNHAQHPHQTALLQAGTRAHYLGHQLFDIEEGQPTLVENRLLPLRAHDLAQSSAQAYPLGLKVRTAYQAWLQQSVSLSSIRAWIKSRYPADYYQLDFKARTLGKFADELVAPFPLSYYYLPGKEVAHLLDGDLPLESDSFYSILAITGRLPQTRLREGLLLPLFDEIIKNKAY